MGASILGHRDTLNIIKNAIKIKPKPNSTKTPYFYQKNTILTPKNGNNVRPERLSKQDDVKKEENDEKDNVLNELMRHEESGLIISNRLSSENVQNQGKEDFLSEYSSGKTLSLAAAKLSDLVTSCYNEDSGVPTSQYTKPEPDNEHKEIDIDGSEDQMDVQIINDEENTGKKNENKITEKYENNQNEEFKVGSVQSSIVALNYPNKKSINRLNDVLNEFNLLTSESTALTNMDTSNTNEETNKEDKDISMNWSGDMTEEQALFNRTNTEYVQMNGMDIMQEEMNEGDNSKKKKIESVSVSEKITGINALAEQELNTGINPVTEEINGISALVSGGISPITLTVPVIEEINVINTNLSDEMFDVIAREVTEQRSVTFPPVTEQSNATVTSVAEQNNVTFPSVVEQNSVTFPSVAEQNRVTIPSVPEQNSITIPSLAEQNGVAIPLVHEQKNVIIEYIIEDTADKLPTEKDTTECIMEDIIKVTQDKETTENAKMGAIMKESRDIDNKDASLEYNID